MQTILSEIRINHRHGVLYRLKITLSKLHKPLKVKVIFYKWTSNKDRFRRFV